MARGFEVTTGLVIQQGLFEDSSTAKHKLGTRMQLADGRVFFYSKNGATAGVAGTLMESLSAEANHENVAFESAAAIGATSVTLVDGGTAATANQYAEGYLWVNDGTGEGHYYKVRSNVATSGSASDSLTLTLYDPIRVAVVASGTSEGSVMFNPYYGLIVATTEAKSPAGVVNFVVTANYYFWLQTYGPCVILSGAAGTIGQMAIPSATNGSVGYYYYAATSDVTATVEPAYTNIGNYMAVDQEATEYTPVFLRLAA